MTKSVFGISIPVEWTSFYLYLEEEFLFIFILNYVLMTVYTDANRYPSIYSIIDQLLYIYINSIFLSFFSFSITSLIKVYVYANS